MTECFRAICIHITYVVAEIVTLTNSDGHGVCVRLSFVKMYKNKQGAAAWLTYHKDK